MAVLGLVAVQPARAATIYWDEGGPNKSWNTATNWSNDATPTSGNEYVLDDSLFTMTASYGLDAPFTIQALTLNSAAMTNLNADTSGTTARTLTLNGLSGKLITVGTSANAAVNIGVTGSVGALTVSLAGNGNIQVASGKTLTFGSSATISGAGTVTKTGAGTVSLAGGNNNYTFTGQLTVAEGVWKINGSNNNNNNGPLGYSTLAVILGSSGLTGTLEYAAGNATISKPFTMAAGGIGAFQIDTAAVAFGLSGVIGGSGGLTKTGAGTLTLTGANTYSGNTLISVGTLSLGNNLALQNSTLDTSGAGVGTLTVTTPTFGGLTGSTNLASVITTGYSSVTALTLNPGTGVTDTYSGVIADGAAGMTLTKSGAGTQVLSGANNYTGATVVGASNGANVGALQLSGSGKISTAATTVYGGTLDLNGTTQSITTLTLGKGAAGSAATVSIGAGELKLGGAVTYDATNNPNGATISGVGGGFLSLLGNRTFTVNDSTAAAADLTVSAVIQNGDGTARNLTKAGAGTLTLSGNNTYTGVTTINAGKVIFSGSNASATGGTTISGGVAQYNSTAAINGTTRNVTVTSPGVVVFAALSDADIATGLARIVAASTGTVAADNNATGAFDFNTAGLTGPSLGAIGTVTYTGALTPNGTTYRLGGGGGTLTLSNTGALTGTRDVAVNGNVTITAVNAGLSAAVSVNSGVLTITDGTIGSGSITLASGTTLALGNNGNRTYSDNIVLTGDAAISANKSGGAGNNQTLTVGTLGMSGQTLTVSGNYHLTFSGLTTLSGTNDFIINASSADPTTLDGGVTGSGDFIKDGTTTLIVNGSRTHSGLITVNAGALTLAGANTGAGGVTLSAAGTLNINNAAALGATAGTFTIAGGTIDSTAAITNDLLTTNNAQNWNGDFTFTGTRNLKLGTGAVTLGATPNVTVTANTLTVGGAISGGGFGITKLGAGTLALSGANDYTGPTTVNAGTLTLSGSPTGNSAVTLNSGGTLTLDYSTNNTSKINDSAVLTLAGGALGLSGGSHTEAVASTTLAAGTVSSVTRSSGSAVLRMNAITHNAAATINFGTAGIADTDTPNTNGILGAWATVGGTDWAVNSTGGADGSITAYSSYTDIAALGSTLADGSATNVRINSTGSGGNIVLSAATTTVNTLLQNTTTAATFNTAAKTLKTSGIKLGSGQEAVTIGAAAGDGFLTAASAGGELWLINDNAAKALTVNAVIADNTSASPLTKTGAGTLTLNGVNTYSGDTTVVGGTLEIGGAGQLGNGKYAGDIAISSGATLKVNSSAKQILQTGVISGAGGLTKAGTGTLVLSAANTYSGATAVNGGALIARDANSLGTSNVTVAQAQTFLYYAAADVPLNISNLNVNIVGTNSLTTLGTSIGSTATSAQISAGNGQLGNGTNYGDTMNIYGVPGITHVTGANIILINAAAGNWNWGGNTTTVLGTVYNNTDFTFANSTPFTRTTLQVKVTSAAATPLTAAYWKGGCSKGNNVWAVSTGIVTTGTSNWTATAGGAVQVLVPGQLADVNISATSPTLAPTSTVLGADMVIKSLTISDTTNGLGLNADGYTLTVKPAVSTAGITMNASVPASTIAADVKLGANQTWTNNSANALAVSGIVSGAFNLTKDGAGTMLLSGANTYSGGTTVSNGKLLVNNTTGSGTGPGTVTVNGGTLGGTGAITGAVTINSGGHYAPGASVGDQSVGSLTLASGSILDFEFNTALTPPNDRTFVTDLNGLTIDGGGFNLYAENTVNPFSTNGTYQLINYTGALGGTGVGALSVLNNDPVKKYTFSTASNWVELLIADLNASWLTMPTPVTLRMLKNGSGTPGSLDITNTSVTDAGNFTVTGTAGTDVLTLFPTGGTVGANDTAALGFGWASTATNGSRSGTITLTNTSNTSEPNQTTSITGVVGNATADMSNVPGTFGSPLTAAVATSYAGLESMAYDTVYSGGAAKVGSTATILAGTIEGFGAPSPATVSMAWRTRTLSEAYPTHTSPPVPADSFGLVSDVVSLTGMDDGSGQTDYFVLQMTYDPALLVGDEDSLASVGDIYLAWLDPGTSLWTNAVLGNYGGTPTFAGVGPWSDYGTIGDLSDDLGRWGVDLTDPTHTAWAVVNHNSQFAVVPEPATLVLLGLGGLGLILNRKRR